MLKCETRYIYICGVKYLRTGEHAQAALFTKKPSFFLN